MPVTPMPMPMVMFMETLTLMCVDGKTGMAEPAQWLKLPPYDGPTPPATPPPAEDIDSTEAE